MVVGLEIFVEGITNFGLAGLGRWWDSEICGNDFLVFPPKNWYSSISRKINNQ